MSFTVNSAFCTVPVNLPTEESSSVRNEFPNPVQECSFLSLYDNSSEVIEKWRKFSHDNSQGKPKNNAEELFGSGFIRA